MQLLLFPLLMDQLGYMQGFFLKYKRIFKINFIYCFGGKGEYQLYRRSTFNEVMGKRCREKNWCGGMQTDMKRRYPVFKLFCCKIKLSQITIPCKAQVAPVIPNRNDFTGWGNVQRESLERFMQNKPPDYSNLEWSFARGSNFKSFPAARDLVRPWLQSTTSRTDNGNSHLHSPNEKKLSWEYWDLACKVFQQLWRL